MKIFVIKNGEENGPYSIEELQEFYSQGSFNIEDLACYDGKNWVTVGQILGLSVDNQDLKASKDKTLLWSSIGFGLVLIVVGLLFWQLSGLNSKELAEQVAENANKGLAVIKSKLDRASPPKADLDDPQNEREMEKAELAEKMLAEAKDNIRDKEYKKAEEDLVKITNYLEPSTRTWPIILNAAITRNQINLEKAEDAIKAKDWKLANYYTDAYRTGLLQDRNIVGAEETNLGRPGLVATRGAEAMNELMVLADQMRSRILTEMGQPQKPLSNPIVVKLKAIQIPAVQFFESPLPEVMAELHRLSKQFDVAEPDPTQKGVNIVVFNVAGEPPPNVTISLNGMALNQMISFISELVGWNFDIRHGAVVISKSGSDVERPIVVETETYEVSLGQVQLMTGVGVSGGIDPFAPDVGNDTGTKVRGFLERAGIPFGDERVHKFVFNHGFKFQGFKLIITHERRFLDLIASILERVELNSSRPDERVNPNKPLSNPIKAKLKAIQIPAVQFFESPLPEVVAELHRLSKQFDVAEPDSTEKGVNIVLINPPGEPPPNVTITLNGMALDQMLQLTAELVGWNIEIRNDAVVVSPKKQ